MAGSTRNWMAPYLGHHFDFFLKQLSQLSKMTLQSFDVSLQPTGPVVSQPPNLIHPQYYIKEFGSSHGPTFARKGSATRLKQLC